MNSDIPAVTFLYISDLIKQIACQVAPDYPNIDDCREWEQLHAIESSWRGVCAANNDLHELVDVLRQRLNMSKEELIELHKKIVSSRNNI